MCGFSTAGATFTRPLFSHFLEQQFSVGAVFHPHRKNLVHLESCCCCVFMRGLIIFRGKATQECTHEKKHTRARETKLSQAQIIYGVLRCVGGKAEK